MKLLSGVDRIPVSTGGMLMNLAPTQFGFNNFQFLNWFSTSNLYSVSITSTLNGSLSGVAAWNALGTGSKPYFNPSTGEVNSPCPSDLQSITYYFFNEVPDTLSPAGGALTNWGPGGTPWWYQYELLVTWNGNSTPSVPGVSDLGPGGSFTVTGSNSATLIIGNQLTDYNIGLTFTINDPTNPPQSIKVYPAIYSANVARGEHFNPDYLADIKQNKIARWMDLICVNTSGQTDISQMADFNYTGGIGRPFAMCAVGTATISNGSGGAGNTLNVSSSFSNSDIEIGSVITIGGGTVNVTAVLGGGNYTVDGAPQNLSAQSFTGVAGIGANSAYGPKAGIHPSIVCEFSNLTGCDAWYCVPVAISNSAMSAIALYFKNNLNPGLKVYFQVGNEVFNFNPGFLVAAYANVQIYPGTGTANNAALWLGYRSAQLWEIVAGVYGSAERSRWAGLLHGEAADQGVAANSIQGATYWINNGSAYTQLNQICDATVIAPYFGPPQSSMATTTITAVGVGTPTTFTASGNGLSTGQIVRLFFGNTGAGTVGSLLNNVDVTVLTANSTQFTASHYGGNSGSSVFNTSTLTYSATATDCCTDGLFMDLMDDSVANNISNPTTYPTKYTYFRQQLIGAFISGGATTNGWVSGTNLTDVQTLITGNALIANAAGLKLMPYEGGMPCGGWPPQLENNAYYIDFSFNWIFDNSTPGNNDVAAAYNAIRNIFGSVNALYNAQYYDLAYAPYLAIRYVPGDENNGKWAAITAMNALGPWVDTTTPATGTYAYITDNYEIVSGTPPYTAVFSAAIGTSLCKVIVGVSWQNGTVVSVVVANSDGSDAVTLNNDFTDVTTAVYSGQVSGLTTPTVTITYSSGNAFGYASAVVWTATNLLSNTVQQTTGGSASLSIPVVEGCMVVSVVNSSNNAPPNYATGSSIAPVTPPGSVYPGFSGGGAYFTPSFTNPAFIVATGAPGGQVIATYR
jgi:hypothetical protein